MASLTFADPLAPGRQVGKYQVVGKLATGGMAEIYLAKATSFGGFEKYVVMKRILPHLAREESFVRLFLNEARLAATLDHPNVANVYDIDQADGTYFFTMEYLHGEDTRYIFRQLMKWKQRLPLEHALTICIGVAAGLHAAHEKRGPDGKPLGIVHRDVSLSNVVVTFEGGVKLVDFGIAKATSVSELTGTGRLKGKLAYMSPQQCRSLPLDRRSDVFSMGIVLYELTTHTRLFKSDSEVETIRLVTDAIVPPPSSRVPGYSPALEAIVMKALRAEPEDRYATARDLQVALEAFVGDSGLVTSSALLGEWMELTFGPKIEPWRMDAEGAAARAAVTTATEIPITVAAPAEVDLSDLPTIAARAPGMDHSETKQLTFPPPPRTHRRAIGAAAGAVVAVVAVWLAGREGKDDLTSAPTAAASNSVVLLRQSGEVALEPPGGTTPHAPPLAPEIVPLADAPIPSAANTPRPHKGGTPRTTRGARVQNTTDQGFSAAFARRKPEISRCLAQYPNDDIRKMQLSIRFRTGTDGHVTAAEIFPSEAANTKFGECVARVAASTRFAPQRGPVAFRIPLTVGRVGFNLRP